VPARLKHIPAAESSQKKMQLKLKSGGVARTTLLLGVNSAMSDTTPREELEDILSPLRKYSISIAFEQELSRVVSKLAAREKALVAEAEKAFGGCKNCYGKGYATTQGFVSGGGKKWQTSPIKYCICDRGKQLQSLTQTNHSESEKT
jgi:hypothetical protein